MPDEPVALGIIGAGIMGLWDPAPDAIPRTTLREALDVQDIVEGILAS